MTKPERKHMTQTHPAARKRRALTVLAPTYATRTPRGGRAERKPITQSPRTKPTSS